jgi:hypothetical protein
MWALQLMGLDISYMPHMVIKSQTLADLVAEGPGLTSPPPPPPPISQEHWTMYFDGSFTLNGAGGGVVLISTKGD